MSNNSQNKNFDVFDQIEGQPTTAYRTMRDEGEGEQYQYKPQEPGAPLDQYEYIQGTFESNSTQTGTVDFKEKQTALKEFFAKYEISQYMQEDISSVSEFEIIIIADDSSSMREPSTFIDIDTGEQIISTRWHELQMTVGVIAEVSTILDSDGIDIWFFNRGEPNPDKKNPDRKKPYKNIKTKEEVKELFTMAPSGRTPMTRVLKEVMEQETKKPKLILILTDGEPNDSEGYSDVDNFKKLLMSRDSKHNRIGIIACTTDPKAMQWLDELDLVGQRIDIVDDYKSEKDQVMKVQGSHFTYTQGDHILKMMLGPIFDKYDKLDEQPLPKRKSTQAHKRPVGRRKNNTCIIL